MGTGMFRCLLEPIFWTAANDCNWRGIKRGYSEQVTTDLEATPANESLNQSKSMIVAELIDVDRHVILF